MKTVALNADVNSIEHIDRFVDLATGALYLIETVDDYAVLPQSIIDMLGAQWYKLQGLPVPPELMPPV